MCVPGSPRDPRSEGTNALIRQGATLVRSVEDVVEQLAPLIGRPAPAAGEMQDERDGGEPLWDELGLLGDGIAAAPRAPGADEAYAAEAPVADEAVILSLLGATPGSVDDLVRAARLPVQAVRMALNNLGSAGRIEHHEGGLVSRSNRE